MEVNLVLILAYIPTTTLFLYVHCTMYILYVHCAYCTSNHLASKVHTVGPYIGSNYCNKNKCVG